MNANGLFSSWPSFEAVRLKDAFEIAQRVVERIKEGYGVPAR